jgi:hypothetical protein
MCSTVSVGRSKSYAIGHFPSTSTVTFYLILSDNLVLLADTDFSSIYPGSLNWIAQILKPLIKDLPQPLHSELINLI